MKFSDLATIRRSTVKAVDFSASDIYVGYEHLEPGALRFSTEGKLDSVTSQKQRFSVGDTIYGRLRPYFRKVGWAATSPGLCSTDLWVFQPKAGVDPRFVFYVAASPAFTDLANASSEGTRMPRASWSVVQNFEVPDFSLDEQKAISAALGSLDDKIESNRRAAAQLYDLIRLRFRHLVSTSAVRRVALGTMVEVVRGRSYKSVELQASRTALVTLKSVDRNGGYREDGLKPYSGPYTQAQVVNPGELVVAQTDLTQEAEVVGRGVRIPEALEFETLVASLDLAIVRPLGGMPREYLYGLLTSDEFREHCRSRVSGTTVLHLAKDAIPSWQAPLIESSSKKQFANEASVLLQRMDSLNRESAQLAELRDQLLPEVLSGRVRVPAERSTA